jgi:DNA polymerase
MPAIEAEGFELILGIHDEHIAEAPADRDDLNADRLGELMCSDLGWNEGLPLAAAGFEDVRYRKE